MALLDQGYIDPYGGRGLLYNPSGTPYNPPETGGGPNPLAGLGISGLLGAGKGLFNGVNPFTSGLGAISSAAGGFLGNKLGAWNNNAGEKIGGTIGGFAGSFLPIPFLGSLMGSAIGSAIGGNFGPPPTVGPNAQAWLGNVGGRLGVTGSSGDNGLNGSTMPGLLGNALNYANSFGPIGNLPKHFQVRAGENGMQPTIEIGNSVDDAYLAPMLSDFSLARAMASRGLINAPDIGRDPRRIFTGANWAEPESIAAPWQGGIYTARGGHEVLDTGRVGNAMLQPMYAPDTRFGWTDAGYGALS